MAYSANLFWEFLLFLCKAVNMRILNGHLFNDKAIGKFICTMHNSESVVDYLFTLHYDFAELSHFSINDLNIYSSHAPISFNFHIANIHLREETRTSVAYKLDETTETEFLNNRKINLNCGPHDGVSEFSHCKKKIEKESYKKTQFHLINHRKVTGINGLIKNVCINGKHTERQMTS